MAFSRKHIGHREMTLFVGICVTAVWMASDMYLPALPVLDDALGTSEAVINISLMTNMVCMAIGALIGGPISDKMGRRKPMLAGLAAMVAFDLALAFVTGPVALITLRVFAGLGGGFVASISMAILKDFMPEDKLTDAISLTQSLAILGPLAAPFLGSLLISVASWRMIFIALMALALICLIWYLPMGETLLVDQRDDVSIIGSLGLIIKVAKNPSFTVLLLALCLAPLAFGVFMVTCSYVFIDFFHMSYMGYSICYFIAMIIEFSAPFIFAFLEKRTSNKAILWVLIGLLAASGAFIMILGESSPVMFLIGSAFFVIAEGMARPFAFLVLLDNADGHVGSASALTTFGINLFTGLGSPLASLAFWPNYVVATGLPSVVCAVLTAILFVILIGPMKSRILDKKES